MDQASVGPLSVEELEAVLDEVDPVLEAKAVEVTADDVEKVKASVAAQLQALKDADPMAMALATKPGAHVINGGRKRMEAEALRGAYARAKKRNGGKSIGRYTAPKPRPVAPEAGE